MCLGVVKESKLQLRDLHASHTLGCAGDAPVCMRERQRGQDRICGFINLGTNPDAISWPPVHETIIFPKKVDRD